MVEHKMFIIFLQGIALFLITTCKAQITLEKIDANGFQVNVNAPLLRKMLIKSLELMKYDTNSKRGASYLQDEVIKNFGQINDTDMKVNVNFHKPVQHSKEIFRPHHPSQSSASDTTTASLTEALSEIDDELKRYRKTICGFDPPKPDFESKGHHRTSQARCLDYIWDIKLEEERRNKLCRGYDDSFSPFIMSGYKVHAGEYPHMGAIGWPAKEDRWIFLCGSSLISHKFVLTVAHCHSVSKDDSRVTHHKPKIVRFGVVNIETDRYPVDIKIRRFISYKKYDYTVKYNDIALIELENVVRFTKNLRPACVWNEFSFGNMKTAAVTGWGISDQSSNTQTTSPNLQVTHLDIIDYKQCRDKLRMKESSDWSGLARHQMCAGKLNGTASACEGDSGGPLQIKIVTNTTKSVYSIIGLTSFGFGCGMARFPSVYTRVSSFIEWIEKEVWEVQEDDKEKSTPYFESDQTQSLEHGKHTSRYYSSKIGRKHSSKIHSKHWYPHSHSHESRRHKHD